MPRPFGVLLIAAAALLFGVYAWFGLVWLLVLAAKLTGTRALDPAMFLLAPHMAGWLVALLLGVVIFAAGLVTARRCRLGWLGFGPVSASDPKSVGETVPPEG
jgi:hypothetical protein